MEEGEQARRAGSAEDKDVVSGRISRDTTQDFMTSTETWIFFGSFFFVVCFYLFVCPYV